ncbi:MAG: GNAT family N-acetyltransferase [Candidatus Micrarchaeota archaeon]
MLYQNELKIRAMLPKDYARVIELTNASFPRAFLSRSKLEGQVARGINYFVAEQEKELIGIISLRAVRDVQIRYIATASAHRNKGIATEFVKFALRFTEKLGKTRIFLEVKASNLPAISLYRALGFSVKRMKTRSSETVLTMEKGLEN